MKKNLDGESIFPYDYLYSFTKIKYLLANEVDVNSVEKMEWIVYKDIWIVMDWNPMPRIFDSFVESGIDLNHQDDKGWTLMHYACNNVLYGDTIEYLLDSGARTDIPDNEGFFFDSAFDRDPFEKQALLLKKGLNFSRNIPDDVRSHSCELCKEVLPVLKLDADTTCILTALTGKDPMLNL